MWRRPLNSTVLATATHRKLKKVSDGTSTQVIAQMINKCKIKMINKCKIKMINKCKIKMIQEELYNVKDLSRRGNEKNSRRDTVALQSVMILNFD